MREDGTVETRRTEYLATIDEVIKGGRYKADWVSLREYPTPTWYRNAKLGIFVHWGVYSVPAFGSEWYPRLMYVKDNPVYTHHIETYGSHTDFPYAAFVPRFRAERFDPTAWAKLFRQAGARYVVPVAEHHDGFQMYNSDLSRWNAVRMGPKRDLLGEMKRAFEKEGLTVGASSHRAENYWFFGGCRTFDSGLQDIEYQEPYGYAVGLQPTQETMDETHEIYSEGANEAHLDDWLARSCELIDRYQPRVVYFDWWIQNMSFKRHLRRFAAYYYNRSLEWGETVAITYKEDAFPLDTAVFDVERGQPASIRPRMWQTCTSIAKNSWGHTENNDFKSAPDLVADLIDIVSKNGRMLLNVGPKADGTITEEERSILEGIGGWMEVNGEAIHDTTYWQRYGEGPTEVEEGSFTDTNRGAYTAEDIRFTYRAPTIYAHVLAWPNDGTVSITTLRNQSPLMNGHIARITVLGCGEELPFERTARALELTVLPRMVARERRDYPFVLKIETE